jgi:hypothetical protein
MSRSKARVFSLAKRVTKAPAAPAAPTPKAQEKQAKKPLLVLEVHDHESGYVIGALLDAQRNASAQQAACEHVGDVRQALVFAQKVAALSDIVARVAKAFAMRKD